MLYFELNGKTYAIRFRRDGLTTFAQLFRVNPSGELEKLEGEGMATCYYKDRFTKAIGRKEALADLLWKYSVPEEGAEFPEGLDKEIRTKIWTEYFIYFRK